jgi:hypothetical protein
MFFSLTGQEKKSAEGQLYAEMVFESWVVMFEPWEEQDYSEFRQGKQSGGRQSMRKKRGRCRVHLSESLTGGRGNEGISIVCQCSMLEGGEVQTR